MVDGADSVTGTGSPDLERHLYERENCKHQKFFVKQQSGKQICFSDYRQDQIRSELSPYFQRPDFGHHRCMYL